MRRALLAVLTVGSILGGTQAFAHRTWLLPSATVLSNEGEWVTVDAAVSNELFYFNHVPLRLDSLQVTGPAGAKLEPQNVSTGKFRSTFDVQLPQTGSYRIALINEGVMASYKLGSEQKRWRGNAADFAKAIPADAKDVQVSEQAGRIEAFVTAGKPDDAALQPSGKGLEMVPVTHPNDLVTGEPATFQFLIDGKPAADLKVTIAAGGSRYVDQPKEAELKTDGKGQITYDWPAAGMYWINATAEGAPLAVKQAKQRRLSYTATVEVLAL